MTPEQAAEFIEIKDALAKLQAAAAKVVLAFPDEAPAEFNIPAYIIDELRELLPSPVRRTDMATKTDWKFKDSAELQGSSAGLWHDLCEGYIKPGELLDDEVQLTAVLSSISTLKDFEQALHDADLIIES